MNELIAMHIAWAILTVMGAIILESPGFVIVQLGLYAFAFSVGRLWSDHDKE